MLPVDETIDRHKFHHHNSTSVAVTSQTCNTSNIRKMNSSNVSTSSMSASCNSGRRKSSLSFHHQQQQQQLQFLNSNETCGGSDHPPATGGRYSPHPNELFLQHSAKLSLQPISDDTLSCCLPPPSPAPHNDRFVGNSSNGMPASPSVVGGEGADCFATPHHHHVQQPLSTSTSTSSLSTNSGGASQHHHVSKFSVHNAVATRPMSPSSNRFRGSGDRFRDQHSVKSSNLIDNAVIRVAHQTPGHSPSLATDAYSYLGAPTAHTPVKRYVPTPPPPHDLYAPENVTLTTSTAGKCGVTASGSAPQHLCTLPYRLRMKCCTNEQALLSQVAPQTIDHRSLSVADYYTTSPRARPSGPTGYVGKCGPTLNVSSASGKESPMQLLQHDPQPMQIGSCARSGANLNGVAVSPSPASPCATLSVQSAAGNPYGRQNTAGVRHDYIRRTPSIEYINANAGINGANAGTRVLSPVLMATTADNAQNIYSNSAGNEAVFSGVGAATCLHCNTTRRTTGVHQTTQTTGPISPIPLQQVAGNSHCLQDQLMPSASPITPATSETPLSPLSSVSGVPATALESHLRLQQVHAPIPEPPKQQVPDAQPPSYNEVMRDNGRSNTVACQQAHQQQLGASQQPPPPTMPTAAAANPAPQPQRFAPSTRKKRLTQYLRREIARFFGVETSTEAEEYVLWRGRQRRLAIRRFGALKSERELAELAGDGSGSRYNDQHNQHHAHHHHHAASERPDILPAQDTSNGSNFEITVGSNCSRTAGQSADNVDFQPGDFVERKASVANMFSSSVTYVIGALSRNGGMRNSPRQWSRSFAPAHMRRAADANNSNDEDDEIYEGLTALQEDEVFFDSPSTAENANNGGTAAGTSPTSNTAATNTNAKASGTEQPQRHQIYMGERVHGWRTSAIIGSGNSTANPESAIQSQSNQHQQSPPAPAPSQNNVMRGMRISAQLLDGILENSRRPMVSRRANQKLFAINDLDDRTDHRPFFTYWINTVQILVLFLSLICYGIGPIGFGVEQRTGQVLVTSLSLQTVQHTEQRNIWIGPRNHDLVHMGAKFATCMRRDVKIMDVLVKTRRQERETACCIRNDDSGCVQSSQADCSVRGLFPTKSISTWKKWSPGESGPGGRISGSVCGLDPKYCDAPASIAPYEWPDDITKWPICRKTNSFSQRFRYKEHTAEHMVCEVIGHPCCTGVYGECRITTREYCDFVNGYFHEEASLCSQISCLNNVCGMFPFFSIEVPDQFYRLFTSLCLHAGILHLAITVAFQHIFLADLERLIGPIRTAIVYIGSGVAGNLTSALLVPYKPEVGPLASLSGVVASLIVLLVLMHWKQLRKPHIALFKLIFIGALLFGLGTLPWQLNFAGLLAGIICGIFLTVALVPFVSISTYGRKSKISLIWSCVFFHLIIYALMMVIFYVFPTELTNLNFGEVLTNTLNTNIGVSGNGNGDIGGRNGHAGTNVANGADVMSSSMNRKQLQQAQYHYHYHTNDFVTNNAAALQIGAETGQQHVSPYHRTYHNSIGNKDSNNNNNNFKNTFIYAFESSSSNNKNNVTNLKDMFLLNSLRKHHNNSKAINNDYSNITIPMQPEQFDQKGNSYHFSHINSDNNNKPTENFGSPVITNSSQLNLNGNSIVNGTQNGNNANENHSRQPMQQPASQQYFMPAVTGDGS